MALNVDCSNAINFLVTSQALALVGPMSQLCMYIGFTITRDSVHYLRRTRGSFTMEVTVKD